MLNDSHTPLLVTAMSDLKQNGAISSTTQEIQASSAFAKDNRWTHTPSRFVLLWLYITIPLLAWDILYCLGRPHTLPGGKWHDPIWTPYTNYAEVDHVYGWKAWEESNGFTVAQAIMNIVENALYVVYLRLVSQEGHGLMSLLESLMSSNANTKSISGSEGIAMALLAGFSGSLMTFSKTVLYRMLRFPRHLIYANSFIIVLNEHCSGYPYIRECALRKVLLYYIIPR